MTKSICIATYNGGKYLGQQLESIVKQLGKDDEIVIVDDCSSDDTLEIVKSFNDNRIKIYQNQINLKHVKSFERAISLSKNQLIFLCDQDDIWVDERLEIFANNFAENPLVSVIASNFYCIDEDNRIFENSLNKVSPGDSFSYTKNIRHIFLGKIGYFGCAMAFRREILSIILPIPHYVEAHDLWIAMAGNLQRANLHIDKKTLYHRLHKNNASDLKRSLYKKLVARMNYLKSYLELAKRIKLN